MVLADNWFIQLYNKAPADIVALFNGSRQVIYGFIPNCSQVIDYIMMFFYDMRCDSKFCDVAKSEAGMFIR